MWHIYVTKICSNSLETIYEKEATKEKQQMNLKKLNLPDREFEEKRVCDDCTRELEVGDHAVEYFSDKIWIQFEKIELPQPVTHEVYCLYCYPDEIPLPHKGTNEGFNFVTVDFNSESGVYILDEVGIIKGSNSSSGVEWEPIKVLTEYHFTPIEAIGYLITPMHVFSMFRKCGIDLRGFISDDTLVIPEDEKIR